MPRQILGPEKEEAAGEQRNLQNGKLHNFCSSPSIRVLGLRWAGHVERLRGYEKCMLCFRGENCRDNLWDLEVNGG